MEEPEWLKVLDPERQAYLRDLHRDVPDGFGYEPRWHYVSGQNELLMAILAELRAQRPAQSLMTRK